MTYGSLFSGIGGIDLGLDRAGFTCRWQCEIEPYCVKVLEKHWPEVKRYGNIKDLTGHELEPVDLICGGYPCQPFSQAGKRGGADDPRHLWPEFARIVRVLRPRFVLLENVPGHLSLGFGSVLGDLSGLGYDAEWTCLRASDFGASHIRKRVFVVAYLADSDSRSCDVSGSEGRGRGAASSGTSEGVATYLEHAVNGGPQERRADCAGEIRAGRSLDVRHAAEESGDDLAHRPSGGLRERGEPSGRGGLADGGDAKLAHSPRDARDRPHGQDGARRGVCEAGDELGDAGLSGQPPWDALSVGDQGLEADDSRPADQLGRASGVPLADPGDGELPQSRRGPQGRDGAGPAGADVPPGVGLADAFSQRDPEAETGYVDGSGRRLDFAPGPADPRWPAIIREYPWLAPAVESPVRGMASRLSDFVDGGAGMMDRTKRLRALGNSVVPACAEYIGRRILEAAR